MHQHAKLEAIAEFVETTDISRKGISPILGYLQEGDISMMYPSTLHASEFFVLFVLVPSLTTSMSTTATTTSSSSTTTPTSSTATSSSSLSFSVFLLSIWDIIDLPHMRSTDFPCPVLGYGFASETYLS